MQGASPPHAGGSAGTLPPPARSARTAADASAQPARDIRLSPELQQAAAEGAAYAIVDLASQRTLAEQHGEWLDAPAWPGSIAKLAMYVAAIDAQVLDEDTHIQCTRQVTLQDGRRVDCSHPVARTPLSLRQAIAWSCNVFGAEVARRLTPTQLAHGFAHLGLPVPQIADSTDRVAIALGLAGTQIPPRQLLSALVRASRMQSLYEGLRESARSGTAAGFGHAGIDALAKTGTALMRNGRPLGLVVALAPAPAPRFGIIVAVPGGAGADAADIAASLLRPRLAASGSGSGAGAGETIRVGVAGLHGYRIDRLPLEEYVARVVAGESSSATPMAAREALAITARTYVLANRGRHGGDGFDVCSLTHCQVLRPATAASREAASRTRAQILARHDDASAKPVSVFYSAACGGRLEDASVLLPDTPAGSLAWMTARDDPAGVEEPAWQTDLSAAELLNALHAGRIRGDTLRGLQVQTNANGRVTAVALSGLTPSTLTADNFRRLVSQDLGWQTLKSLRFTVERTARGYRFTGRGHGHGVGLCMLGASALATRGKTATDILQTYFPGLQVIAHREDRRSATSQSGLTTQPTGLTTNQSGLMARQSGLTTHPNGATTNQSGPMAKQSGLTTQQSGVITQQSGPAPKGHPPSLAASDVATADRAATKAAATIIDVRLPAAEEGERASLRSLLDRDLRELSAALGGSSPPARLSLIVYPSGDSYRRATGRPWWTSAATTVDDNGSATAKARATIRMVPLAGLRRTGRLEATVRHEVVHVLTAPQLRARPLWVREGIAAHFAGEHLAAPAGDESCPTDADFARAPSSEAFQQAYARAAACVARELSRGTRWDAIR